MIYKQALSDFRKLLNYGVVGGYGILSSPTRSRLYIYSNFWEEYLGSVGSKIVCFNKALGIIPEKYILESFAATHRLQFTMSSMNILSVPGFEDRMTVEREVMWDVKRLPGLTLKKQNPEEPSPQRLSNQYLVNTGGSARRLAQQIQQIQDLGVIELDHTQVEMSQIYLLGRSQGTEPYLPGEVDGISQTPPSYEITW